MHNQVIHVHEFLGHFFSATAQQLSYASLTPASLMTLLSVQNVTNLVTKWHYQEGNSGPSNNFILFPLGPNYKHFGGAQKTKKILEELERNGDCIHEW